MGSDACGFVAIGHHASRCLVTMSAWKFVIRQRTSIPEPRTIATPGETNNPTPKPFVLGTCRLVRPCPSIVQPTQSKRFLRTDTRSRPTVGTASLNMRAFGILVALVVCIFATLGHAIDQTECSAKNQGAINAIGKFCQNSNIVSPESSAALRTRCRRNERTRLTLVRTAHRQRLGQQGRLV